VDENDQIITFGEFTADKNIDFSKTVSIDDTKDMLETNTTYTVNTTYQLDGQLEEHDLASAEFTTKEAEVPFVEIKNINPGIVDATFDIVIDNTSITDDRFYPTNFK
jgi:hypothetical protein